MNKLKPCPFCGGEVDNFHTNHKSRTFREHYFRCKKCEAYFSLPSKSDYRSAEETEREAKELWNRRADDIITVDNVPLYVPLKGEKNE